MRPMIVLESKRFVGLPAFAKLIEQFLEYSDYSIEAVVQAGEAKELARAMPLMRSFVRLKVSLASEEVVRCDR